MTKPDHIKKFETLELGEATALKIAVWRLRSSLRKSLNGRDPLDVEKHTDKTGRRLRYIYRQIDKFMGDFFPNLVKTTPKKVALARVREMIDELNYTIVEADENRPWGAFYRLNNDEAGRFIHEFFPGLSLHEAKLGHSDVVLSPKFLIVAPGQRLSWQFHHRRAERWRFLTDGGYYLSDTDKPGHKKLARAGDSIQCNQGERHRLSADNDSNYVIIAEIWQHTDPDNPSDEADVMRLIDDYHRS